LLTVPPAKAGIPRSALDNGRGSPPRNLLHGCCLFASNLFLPGLLPLLLEVGYLGFQLLNAVQQLLNCPSYRVGHEVVVEVNAVGGDAALMGWEDCPAWIPTTVIPGGTS
jgi:hypothetical protein